VDAPAPIGIHLLGGFHVAVPGRVLPADAWRQRRSAAVVKLLALAPAHRLHRAALIETLWPEPVSAVGVVPAGLHSQDPHLYDIRRLRMRRGRML
jgi:hypothetical protein